VPSSSDCTISLPFLPINVVSSYHLPCSAVNCVDIFYVVKYIINLLDNARHCGVSLTKYMCRTWSSYMHMTVIRM